MNGKKLQQQTATEIQKVGESPEIKLEKEEKEKVREQAQDEKKRVSARAKVSEESELVAGRRLEFEASQLPSGRSGAKALLCCDMAA